MLTRPERARPAPTASAVAVATAPPPPAVCACGRKPADGFPTCCKSCPYVFKQLGVYGHTAKCDIAHDDGMSRPWYWRLSDLHISEGTTHNEEQSAYVTEMGTKLLQKTLPSVQVRRTVRVEDDNLWKRYAARRAAVRKKKVPPFDGDPPETLALLDYSAKKTLDRSVNEAWFFHGTSEDAARSIGTSDFRLPGHAGLFGKGLYFADEAIKSNGYSQQNADGEKVMMLCRVILGKTLKVTGTDRQAENRIRGTDYDSLQGKTNHREFLVYDNSLVYPEYIMFYK